MTNIYHQLVNMTNNAHGISQKQQKHMSRFMRHVICVIAHLTGEVSELKSARSLLLPTKILCVSKSDVELPW
jgi:hypothetical protein